MAGRNVQPGADAISAPGELVISRVFEAPRNLVFKARTA